MAGQISGTVTAAEGNGRSAPRALVFAVVAVSGGYANSAVIAGGGSSPVDLRGGPARSVLRVGQGPFAGFQQIQYRGSVPLKAILALTLNSEVVYRDGNTIVDAFAHAWNSEVAINQRVSHA